MLPALGALVVLGLWAYGRYQRRLIWSAEPTVRFERAIDNTSTTAVLVLTGAFNGPPHTEEIVNNSWVELGDTYVVDYALLRFDIYRTMLAAYRCVAGKKQYDQVLVAGYSLGGLISLHLLRHARRHDPALAEKIRLLPADAPLGVHHLRLPGGGIVPRRFAGLARLIASLLRFVHFGPLFNRLSSFVCKVMFVPAPAEMCSPYMNEGLFSRHMAFLRSNKLSLVIEQIAAIATQKPFTQEELGDTPVYYLQCGDGTQADILNNGGKIRNNPDAPDKVILGDAACEDWRRLFPNMQHAYVGPKTMHVALVEGTIAWGAASNKAAFALLS